MSQMMFSKLALQTPIRGYKYLMLYIPDDLSDITLEDCDYMDQVIEMQMRVVRKMIERRIAESATKATEAGNG